MQLDLTVMTTVVATTQTNHGSPTTQIELNLIDRRFFQTIISSTSSKLCETKKVRKHQIDPHSGSVHTGFLISKLFLFTDGYCFHRNRILRLHLLLFRTFSLSYNPFFCHKVG